MSYATAVLRHPRASGFVLFVLGVFLFVRSFSEGASLLRFADGARGADARIQSLRKSGSLAPDHFASVTWRDAEGREQSGEVRLYKRQYGSARRGDTLRLRVSASEPRALMTQEMFDDAGLVHLGSIPVRLDMFLGGLAAGLLGGGLLLWGPRLIGDG